MKIVLIMISLIIILLITWQLWKKLTWKTVMVSDESQPQRLIRKTYEQLKSEDVRCKIKAEVQDAEQTPAGVEPILNDPPPPHASVLKLEVHRNDLKKLNELEA
ncbi:hypothetical protein EJF36_02595 [Bacillus sp. HMF5848]|uniref:hypothetical protein n=1 Tax=Bacillus sp. HMF5848 TaxID=2495421 RepID=UPI000F785CCE|nr:hypothetical protein [Bacillus sp. HMF5848]RSK25869.1 hypothetical protein EJF36_02595 [Bacillus sp. HMF5848]